MAIGNVSDPYVKRETLDLAQQQKKGNSFPPDIYTQPVWFTIQLREFVSVSSVAGGQFGINPFGALTPAISGSYFNLPMPISGLQDNFQLGYSQAETGALGGVGATIMDTVNNPSNIVGNIVGAAASGAATLARGLAQTYAEQLGNKIGQGKQARALTGLTLGAISNPNLAAVFEGVNLRKHQFTWQLIAFDKSESDMIMNIVNGLKKGALPKKEAGANFALLYPNVAYLFINGNIPLNGKSKNNLLTFSKNGMFIESISVDYMGSHQHPAFFTGTNDPLEVRLTISFLERSIVTQEDIGG